MKFIFQCGDYRLSIYKTIPKSCVLDYDYSTGERYLCTYINHLVVQDPIIGTEIVHLTYPDDTACIIKNSIYELSDNIDIDNNDVSDKPSYKPVFTSINIPAQSIGGTAVHPYVSIAREADGIYIAVSSNETVILHPDTFQLKSLYDALDDKYDASIEEDISI